MEELATELKTEIKSKQSGSLYARMYEKMVLTRRFEEVSVKLEKEGKVFGGCHVCLGQEACAVGAVLALRDDDYVTTTHRGDGHNIAKLGDEHIKSMMAELFGRATGCCKGRAGQMHLGDWRQEYDVWLLHCGG